ncbi:DNA polymerase IV [Sediminitomix flava]|uniref:DNA polymerase IV n=1 Tax=Sediminitomix flava TaxID=379075 RepID=A0A315Z7G1_SEDFL|nr:DNA polymerase IV [Sediminitomix flava]PWJ39991.1 DNA polymerase-4 [Sediminitomix flava]
MENIKDDIEPIRKIIHVDMDAFYASVEQRDNPDLRGKPIAVGGDSKRGVVAAASYEARKFGVRSAMSSVVAKRKCKDLIFVRARFEVYKEVSGQIRSVFEKYTDLIEPLSLDEAYLDVTENKLEIKSAIRIAQLIRREIKELTGLTASAGVSYNKFLAKTASDLDKPDGLSVILPNQAIEFLENLAIEKFYGIGKVTSKKMKSLGIHRGKDLKMWPESELKRLFGKSGSYYFNIVRGIDGRRVISSRERKSVGAELTFFDDLNTIDELTEKLQKIEEILWKRIEKIQKRGKTLTLKVKNSDFTVLTRSKTVDHLIQSQSEIREIYMELLNEWNEQDFQIRLLGLSISNLSTGEPKKEHIVRQLKINYEGF